MSLEKTTADLEKEIFRLEEEIRSREAIRQEQPQLPPMLEIEEFIRKNPIIAVGIAITLGVSVGYLLRNMNASSGFLQKLMSGLEGNGENSQPDILSMLMKFLK
ncbi:MAG: hypothetical protein J0L62_01890 [Bacteroidetes bacterium]|nr:hypothetical protein [Bacteroidota bacterium]